MSIQTTENIHAAHEFCGIKFAFDINTTSPFAWPEYFGFSDVQTMIRFHIDAWLFNGNKDETLFFEGVVYAGAILPILFSTEISPERFTIEYNRVVAFLERATAMPMNNPCETVLENCRQHLKDDNITLADNTPETIYRAYNIHVNGYDGYLKEVAAIALRKSAQQAA
jgi:hypothetical protein